jgi:hypothetical protein
MACVPLMCSAQAEAKCHSKMWRVRLSLRGRLLPSLFDVGGPLIYRRRRVASLSTINPQLKGSEAVFWRQLYSSHPKVRGYSGPGAARWLATSSRGSAPPRLVLPCRLRWSALMYLSAHRLASTNSTRDSSELLVRFARYTPTPGNPGSAARRQAAASLTLFALPSAHLLG